MFPKLHHTNLKNQNSQNLLPPFDGISSNSTSNSTFLNLEKPFPISIESIQNDFMFLP